MRKKFNLFNNSFRNGNIGEGIIAKRVSESFYKNNPRKPRKKNFYNILFLNYFWNKLIFKPESFTLPPQTTINKIWSEETGISADKIITSILAEKFGLLNNSTELFNALEESHKIYHEDFPGDFVLEFQGERLGMAILDICYISNQEARLIYRFNPEIKNFNGLF